MDVDLSTCSERFFKGVRWLENELKFDEDKIKIKVEEKKEELLKEKDSFRETAIKIRIEILNKRLRLKYVCSDVEAIYILKKVNSKLADEFISTARDHAFWRMLPI